jgi:hypothetical protein
MDSGKIKPIFEKTNISGMYLEKEMHKCDF